MTTPAPALPGTWNIALADVIESAGAPRFPSAFRRLLGLCCEFDSLVVTRYRGSEPPHCLFHDLDEVQAAIAVTFYATGPYLLDPFYLAGRNRRTPGAYRLRDLVGGSFFRSEYYRSFYRRTRIGDETGILIPEDESRWLILSLARRLRRPLFSPQDTAAIDAALPVIRAAARRHWGEAALQDGSADDASFDDRLTLFGQESLSPREAELIQLVLRGHSSLSAAEVMGISPSTAKVHRRHAYAKLGIGSQSELFAMATRFLVARES